MMMQLDFIQGYQTVRCLIMYCSMCILMDGMIYRYGVPQQLHSDQGSNLNAEVNQKLCHLHGIERTRTTAYHPQGNGQVERFNRTVEAMLAKMVGEHHSDWDKHLQKAIFAYRTLLHESTGYSPYLVNFGRSPVLPVDVMLGRFDREGNDGNIPQYIKEVRKTLKNAYDVILVNLDVAQKNRTQDVKDKHCSETNFRIGDSVAFQSSSEGWSDKEILFTVERALYCY